MAKLGEDYHYETRGPGESGWLPHPNGNLLDRAVNYFLKRGLVPEIRVVSNPKEEELDRLTKVARKGSGLYEEKS